MIDAAEYITKSLEDHAYYCRETLRILAYTENDQVEETRGVIPFELNEAQKTLDGMRTRQLQDRGYVRIVILKPRQTGYSTLIQSYGFKQVHLVNYSSVTTISHHTDSTKRIFEMSKRFLRHMPKEILSLSHVDKNGLPKIMNKRNMVFIDEDFKGRDGNTVAAWESFMEVFTAGKEHSARSGNYTFCHSSEVAYHKDGQARNGIVSAIGVHAKGTEIYDESTGNGASGFFHEHFWAADKGQTDFESAFFPWYMFKKYSLPIPNVQVREELMETVLNHKLKDRYGDEETEMRLYSLSWEQLYWRRSYIANNCQGMPLKPLDYFKQEMPATKDEAFITTSGSVFNVPLIRLKESQCEKPLFVGGLRWTDTTKKAVKPYEDPDGYLKIWRFPDFEPYTNRYCSGVDTMQGGGMTGDPHALYVWDRSVTPRETVACYRGFTQTTSAFVEFLHQLAVYYNKDIMYLIERIGWGVSIINELYDVYKKLMYNREEFKRTKKLSKEIIGWQTTPQSKPILIADLNDGINNTEFICYDPEFFKECITFVYGERYRNKPGIQMGAMNKGGKGAARIFDDRVMGMGMTKHCDELMNAGWVCRLSMAGDPEWAKRLREERENVEGATYMSE